MSFSATRNAQIAERMGEDPNQVENEATLTKGSCKVAETRNVVAMQTDSSDVDSGDAEVDVGSDRSDAVEEKKHRSASESDLVNKGKEDGEQSHSMAAFDEHLADSCNGMQEQMP